MIAKTKQKKTEHWLWHTYSHKPNDLESVKRTIFVQKTITTSLKMPPKHLQSHSFSHTPEAMKLCSDFMHTQSRWKCVMICWTVPRSGGEEKLSTSAGNKRCAYATHTLAAWRVRSDACHKRSCVLKTTHTNKRRTKTCATKRDDSHGEMKRRQVGRKTNKRHTHNWWKTTGSGKQTIRMKKNKHKEKTNGRGDDRMDRQTSTWNGNAKQERRRWKSKQGPKMTNQDER